MAQFFSHSVNDTVLLGEKVGKAVSSGGKVIAFYGDLGAGKTAFTSGVAKGMNISCDVSSPTFAIVNDYGGNPPLVHFDMYKVESWEDLYSSGYYDYMDMGAVLCVEWSENIENALPDDAIRITINRGDADNERIITVEGLEL